MERIVRKNVRVVNLLLSAAIWVHSKWVDRVIASFPSRHRRMRHRDELPACHAEAEGTEASRGSS